MVSSQRWKQDSKRGTIDPGVVVRRSRFETTALEMPAGFGRIHHRANLARDGWPGPHLRTGDVTLIFADYLAWLSTLTDTEDYFTAAYAAMKQEGVVRMVQAVGEPRPLLAANF